METNLNFTIEEVTDSSHNIADHVRKLVDQLDNEFQELTDEDFDSMIKNDNSHLYIARSTINGQILGMITLIVYRIPYKMKGQLEDLVVDTSARGQGVGTELLKYAIEKARQSGVKSLNLTSRPTRESANNLYLRLGFEKRDTNVYRITL